MLWHDVKARVLQRLQVTKDETFYITLVKTIYYHGVEDFVNHERNILSVTLQIAFFIAYSFKVYAWIQEFVWTNHCNTASRPHLHKSSLEDAVLLEFFWKHNLSFVIHQKLDRLGLRLIRLYFPKPFLRLLLSSRFCVFSHSIQSIELWGHCKYLFRIL